MSKKENFEHKIEEIQHNFEQFKPIDINLLKQAPWNYKNTDDTLQAKLAANIKRSGQVENILVRELGDGTYEVVNGNHRLLALQHLGYKKVFAFDLGAMSLNQAKRLALETNETKFDSDPIQLAKLVTEVNLEFQDFSTTAPWSSDQMENFGSMIAFDWDAADKVDEEPPVEETEKGNKTETVLSVAGENHKTLKLELSSACADRLSYQLTRLQALSNGSADEPINIICALLEITEDAKIADLMKATPKKAAKKPKQD